MDELWATRYRRIIHMAKKSKKTKSKPKKAKVEPVPKGFGTVTPYLAINGAAAAIDWYKKAFGAKELARQPTPDGKLMHARIRIGDSILMMSDVFPGTSTQTTDSISTSQVTLNVNTTHVNKLPHKA